MNKFDRLLDAIENPGEYSAEELDKLLADPEVRRIYELLGKTNEALAESPEVDVDKEWESFERTHYNRPKILYMFNRHVAAIVVSVVVSLAAVAAGIGIKMTFDNRNSETVAAVGAEVGEDRTVHVADTNADESVVEPEVEQEMVIVFKDETLETIIGEVKSYYQVDAVFNSPSAKNLRLYFKWDKRQPIDGVVEKLNNFEQISIKYDNGILSVD